jgi:hypothetical protein
VSLSGELGEIGLFEVIQMLHQLRKTGELHVSSEVEGRVGFCRGLIVAVGVPGSRYLGDILLARGMVSETALGAALRLQFEEGGSRSLGQILIARCQVAREELAAAVIEQIHENAQRLFACREGRFHFVACPVNPIDDVALAPLVSLDPQHLMLEVARRIDERGGRRPSIDDPVAERSVADDGGVSGIHARSKLGEPGTTAYLYLRQSGRHVELPFGRK